MLTSDTTVSTSLEIQLATYPCSHRYGGILELSLPDSPDDSWACIVPFSLPFSDIALDVYQELESKSIEDLLQQLRQSGCVVIPSQEIDIPANLEVLDSAVSQIDCCRANLSLFTNRATSFSFAQGYSLFASFDISGNFLVSVVDESTNHQIDFSVPPQEVADAVRLVLNAEAEIEHYAQSSALSRKVVSEWLEFLKRGDSFCASLTDSLWSKQNDIELLDINPHERLQVNIEDVGEAVENYLRALCDCSEQVLHYSSASTVVSDLELLIEISEVLEDFKNGLESTPPRKYATMYQDPVRSFFYGIRSVSVDLPCGSRFNLNVSKNGVCFELKPATAGRDLWTQMVPKENALAYCHEFLSTISELSATYVLKAVWQYRIERQGVDLS